MSKKNKCMGVGEEKWVREHLQKIKKIILFYPCPCPFLMSLSQAHQSERRMTRYSIAFRHHRFLSICEGTKEQTMFMEILVCYFYIRKIIPLLSSLFFILLEKQHKTQYQTRYVRIWYEKKKTKSAMGKQQGTKEKFHLVSLLKMIILDDLLNPDLISRLEIKRFFEIR